MNWIEGNTALEKHVRPATLPIALKMLSSVEEIPEKARRPWRDMGVQMATCQIWNTARRYGWTMAAMLEDLRCPAGKVVLGFQPAVSHYLEGQLCANMYTATAEAGARSEAVTPRYDHGRYQALVVAPLARVTFEPDVVIVYGNPAQVLRLITAALYQQGGRLESSFGGRLVCADMLVGTPQSGRPQVVMPCFGDRIFAQTQDDELAFALPAALLSDLVAGLEGTHKGGLRYPVPSFVRYTAQFPAAYEQLEEIWKEK